MRILFFIDSFPAGGKERRLVELMKGLKKNPGMQLGLVIMSHDVHYKEIFDLDIKIHFVIRQSKKDFFVFSKFYRLCKEFKPDIVHCWDSMTAVYLVPVTRLLGLKFVNGMVVDTPAKTNYGNKTWARARLTFPFSHVILGNSKAGLAAYGAPTPKSLCIYNGFNFDRINDMANGRDIRNELAIKTPFIVGMVASFSKFKDYRTFYEAAQTILHQRKDITFLAIGDNTDSVNSEYLIEDMYKEHFRLLGRRSHIESFVNSMDVCVLATFTEGLSNSILEYMALGKPVVATDGGGTPEIVEDGITGFLVKTGNSLQLAEKIELLLDNKELRHKMGTAGKKRVAGVFSIDEMMNKYVQVYHRLITPRGVQSSFKK